MPTLSEQLPAPKFVYGPGRHFNSLTIEPGHVLRQCIPIDTIVDCVTVVSQRDQVDTFVFAASEREDVARMLRKLADEIDAAVPELVRRG